MSTSAAFDASSERAHKSQDVNAKIAPEKQRKTSLEAVPSDMRRYLLSCLDLVQLKTLVRASPIYHAQYLQDRPHLLLGSLKRTLKCVAVDAFAVHTHQAPAECVEEYVSAMFKAYEKNKKQCRSLLFDKLDFDDIVSMAQFHIAFVAPLSEAFASSAITNLDHEISNSSNFVAKSTLTQSELIRVTRALYRFHLLSLLTERNMYDRNWESEDSSRALISVLEPWEIEELLAIFEWAKAKYVKFIEDVRWDLHPKNPKFADQPRGGTPDGAISLDDWTTGLYEEGTTLRGLQVLHTVLFNIQNHEHLVSVMLKNMRTSYIPISMTVGLFNDLNQEVRYRDNPTDRDRLQESRVLLPFRGDAEPDAPPLAWTIIWGGIYSNLYGCFIPEKLRSCGYVFWDAARLESGDRLQVIEQLRKDVYDARNYWDGIRDDD